MSEVTVGRYCVAEFEEMWFRAQITAVDDDDNTVTVRYVDYGNVDVKPKDQVRNKGCLFHF